MSAMELIRFMTHLVIDEKWLLVRIVPLNNSNSGEAGLELSMNIFFYWPSWVLSAGLCIIITLFFKKITSFP